MNRSHSLEDDLQPDTEEVAQQWLVEFSHWRSIRPAWLREDRQEPRTIMPYEETARYFGDMFCNKFERALNQAFVKHDPKTEEDLDVLRHRSQVRHILRSVPRPESWMDAWPDFWDFFTRARPEGPPRLNALFRAWPMMDESAVDEIMSAWEAGGRAGSLAIFAKLGVSGVNVPRTVCRMKAQLNLPFKELARDWCKNLGLESQITEAADLTSTEQKFNSSEGDDGLSVGDKLQDDQVMDASITATLADSKNLVSESTGSLFASLSLQERTIASVQMFNIRIYKSPVLECQHLRRAKSNGRQTTGASNLYAISARISTQMNELAQQLLSDPSHTRRVTEKASRLDASMEATVRNLLEAGMRRRLCAWLGLKTEPAVVISESAPSWVLDLLTSAIPHWQTMNTNDLIQP